MDFVVPSTFLVSFKIKTLLCVWVGVKFPSFDISYREVGGVHRERERESVGKV
jgi:hypothetical protein